MAVEPTLKPAGLITDPNPITGVPPGAMREASNVVIRRDGIVQPRPGFKKTLLVDDESAPNVTSVARLVPWKDSTLVYQSDGTAAFYLNESGGTQLSNSYQLTGAVGTDFVARAVETRSNLYVCASDGVRKYASDTDNEPDIAGRSARRCTAALSLQGSTGWFTTLNYVAYRIVIQHRDENAVVVNSAPSGRYIIYNSAGAGRTVQLIVGFTAGADADVGDEILVYRSVMSTTAPPADECFLAFRHVITSADYAADAATILDETDEADLGEALYSNASVEGALQANDPPPKVADLALFRGSLFGANVTGRRALTLTWSAITNNTRTGVADGVGFRQYLGDTTIGSPIITNVTTTVGVEVGMWITMAGVPSGSIVTGVAATTITVNGNATANATGVAGTAYDTIKLQGDGSFETFGVPNPMTLVDNINRGGTLSSNGAGVPSAYWRASLLTDLNTASSGTEQRSTVLIEELAPGSAAIFHVQGTHASEYQPVIAAPSATLATADDVAVDSNRVINGLIYSKRDQPEAMPYPANMERVGSSSHAIDRILATKDALWIFKRDGVFRLTGSGASSGWRIDPFDMTTYLIATDSAVVMDDAIYAWTNRGVVRVSDAGVESISALTIGDQLRDAEAYGISQATNDSDPFGSPASSVMAAGWAVANTKDDEYILCVPEDLVIGEGVTFTPTPYVYNTKTLAWTRWNMRHDLSAGAIIGDGRIVFGGLDDDDNGALSLERSALNTSDAPLNADWEYTADPDTASTIDDLGDGYFRVRFSPAVDNYTATVGDVILYRESGTPTWETYDAMCVITAVASNTDFTVYAPDLSTEPSYSGVIFESYQSDLEFVAKIAGQPGAEKVWTSGTVFWGSTRLLDRYASSFTSSLVESAVSTTQRTDGWPDSDADVPQIARFWVPRNHARSGVLYPKFTVSHAGSDWQMYGITLANLAAYPRVRR